MECIYATLLLHHAGQKINEENIKRVLKAANIEPEEIKIKALIAALSEVNLEEILKGVATIPAMPVAVTPTAETKVEKKEEKKEKEEKAEEKKEEEALEGLSALFG
jgi:large subunit ribosomal protein L12